MNTVLLNACTAKVKRLKSTKLHAHICVYVDIGAVESLMTQTWTFI